MTHPGAPLPRGLSAVGFPFMASLCKTYAGIRILTTLVAFCCPAVLTSCIATGSDEKAKQIRIVTWDGRATMQYDVASDSTLGKSMSRWYASLPFDTAFSTDLKNYASSRVIYFPNGERVNITGNRIVARIPQLVLDSQVSGEFSAEDPVMSEIVQLIKLVEAKVPARKR